MGKIIDAINIFKKKQEELEINKVKKFFNDIATRNKPNMNTGTSNLDITWEEEIFIMECLKDKKYEDVLVPFIIENIGLFVDISSNVYSGVIDTLQDMDLICKVLAGELIRVENQGGEILTSAKLNKSYEELSSDELSDRIKQVLIESKQYVKEI